MLDLCITNSALIKKQCMGKIHFKLHLWRLLKISLPLTDAAAM